MLGKMTLQRLQREYIHLMKEPIAGVGTVSIDSNNPFLWKAHLIGPEGSPYQDGFIEVDLIFSGEYPNKPPNIRFQPPFFHANVGTDGHLCLTLFTDWRTTDTVTTILLALNNLLANPNRNSPLQGRGLTEHEYLKQAQKWTKDYGKMSE